MGLIRWIVSDLDRTLLGTDKRISPYTVGILEECRRRGLQILFATARPERATRRIQRDFTPDFVCADNGALTLASGRRISGVFLPQETKTPLLLRLRDHPAVTCITLETGSKLYTGRLFDPLDGEDWNLVETDFAVLPPEPATKVSVECGDPAVLGAILADFPELRWYGNQGEPWSQVTHQEATKWNAVFRLAQSRGVGAHEIAAFGDDQNDLEMLTHAGWGVAVENAADSVKAAARAVCPGHQEDGVARWIAAHVLRLVE